MGNSLLPSDENGLLINAYNETSIPGVYAIGNANNLEKFSNRAIAEAFTSVNHILGRKRGIDHIFIRHITGIYEYAIYGQNEATLKANNIPYIVKTYNPKVISDENIIKVLKILIHRYTHEVLGLFMVGTNTNDQMNTALMVIEDSNYLDYISRSQIVGNAYLMGKHLSDLIKDLDLRVIKHDLISYYQPKIDLQTGKIIGAESLARFFIDGRYHNPLPFIENFEKRGHIYEMDLKVINNAKELVSELVNEHLIGKDFNIAVNIAPETLGQLIPKTAASQVEKHGITPDHIKFEVTKRNFNEGIDFLTPLHELKKLGFRISMDDFSVGNSSLALLNVFPFDEVKLDMSLLPQDENDIAQINAYQNILGLVRNKTTNITAEGVETAFHAAFLKANNVKNGQGYYFARPLPKDEFIKLLKAQNEKRD